MKKKMMILLLASAAAAMTACGSSTNQAEAASEATEALPEATEYDTEDIEADDWEINIPEYEETPEEKEYDAVADQLEYEALETDTGLVLHVKNPSEPGDVQTDIDVQFLDQSGEQVWFSSAEFNSLPVGEDLYVPIDMEGKYASYDVTFTTQQAYMDDMTDSVTAEYAKNDDGGLTAELTNGGEKEITLATIVTLYYDDDKLVGSTIDYDFEILPGNTNSIEITQPVNYLNGDAVEYNRYEIYTHCYAESDEMASEIEAEGDGSDAPESDDQELMGDAAIDQERSTQQ